MQFLCILQDLILSYLVDISVLTERLADGMTPKTHKIPSAGNGANPSLTAMSQTAGAVFKCTTEISKSCGALSQAYFE